MIRHGGYFSLVWFRLQCSAIFSYFLLTNWRPNLRIFGSNGKLIRLCQGRWENQFQTSVGVTVKPAFAIDVADTDAKRPSASLR
jgi:hypothetical protein